MHLQETDDLEQVLSFLIFADGCAASLVSADPVGLALESFHTTVLPDSARQITWHIGRRGFDMLLSGQVPLSVAKALMTQGRDLLGGLAPPSIRHWAVHPGGRSILDAVEQGLGLPQTALHASREVLRRFGNMSSATVMFVLQQLLQPGTAAGRGCAMAFGPGLSVESLLFRTAGGAN